MKKKNIIIMDTTLRDGEQTSGVSFTGPEKLFIAQKLLSEVHVNRLEVASCRVSPEEHKTLALIMDWATKHGHINDVEVLSFVDHKKSVDWLHSAGCRRMNLLTKGSKHHCTIQLRKTLKEHLADIEKTVKYAQSNDIKCSVYLEDWSNGMIHSKEYVFEMLEAYKDFGFEKIHLPDTLGILNPTQTREFVYDVIKTYPNFSYEFHAHNDYGLATANCFAAVESGVSGLHVTINGLGERAGNARMAEVIAVIDDHAGVKTTVDEKKLKHISEFVEALSGKRISGNTPIVGNDVFTQTAGIHADGDKKGNLYESKLSPTRFERTRIYALGKLSGKSNLDFNLEQLNLELTSDQKKAVLAKIIELGDSKKVITSEDLPFLVSDLFSSPQDRRFRVLECVITSSLSMKPVANIRVNYEGNDYETVACGNGGYDAFMNALERIAPEMGLTIPKLLDFAVHIPKGGSTDALVETTILWSSGIKTRAISGDQVRAAIIATERMLNFQAQNSYKNGNEYEKQA